MTFKNVGITPGASPGGSLAPSPAADNKRLTASPACPAPTITVSVAVSVAVMGHPPFPGRRPAITGRAGNNRGDDQPVTSSTCTGVPLVSTSYTADRLRDCSTIRRSVASSASPSMRKVTVIC